MARRKNSDNTVDDAKRAERQARREAKKKANALVLDFVRNNTEDEQLLEAVALLTPKRPGGGGGGRLASATPDIKERIMENGSLDEDTIWSEFKLGRTEMRKITRNFIKKAKDPEERIWVSFDPQEGVYTYEGQGSEPPAGWTGYRPVDVEDIDLDA